MRVQVRLFAGLRERAGADEIELELPEGARVRDALERLHPVSDGLKVVMAVNREYASEDAVLHAGDELALIPPVSGGSPWHARVTREPLDPAALLSLVRDPRAGAVVLFEGVTREVSQLEYEAYTEMAVPKMAEIIQAAIRHYGLCAAAAEHRIGTVRLSEPSVLVAASAPHRTEAFAGAREIIDEIKRLAPIWKQEEDTWVQGPTPTPS
jgi:molybdopterin synthase catalytic subunit